MSDVQSIDDLLDSTLDDLSDMPAFKPLPAGAYKMKLNFEVKPIGGVQAIECKMTVIEVAELTDPNTAEADIPKAGDSSNVLYMLKNKDGTANELAQGQFKNLMAKIAPAFPDAKSNGQLIVAANGVEVLGITGQRKDKDFKNNGKIYTTLENVEML